MPSLLRTVTVLVEPLADGGLRAYSDDVFELVLSSADSDALLADIVPAVETILTERLGDPLYVSRVMRSGEKDWIIEPPCCLTFKVYRGA